MNSHNAYIGESFATKKGAIYPQSIGVAVNGAGVDRLGFYSCTATLHAGAIGGDVNPTAVVVKLVVQHSSDNTTWSDFANTPDVTAANTSARVDVDLSGAARWIRLRIVPAFTNGTNPKISVCGSLVLGASIDRPVVD